MSKETSLRIGYNELVEATAQCLGYSRDSADWGSVVETVTIASDVRAKYDYDKDANTTAITTSATLNSNTIAGTRFRFRGGGSYVIDSVSGAIATVRGDASHEFHDSTINITADIVDPAGTQYHQIDDLVQSAYRQVLAAHNWTFCRPVGTLVTWPSYASTSGITVTGTELGTVQATDDIMSLAVDDATMYESCEGKTIGIVTSGTQSGAASYSATTGLSTVTATTAIMLDDMVGGTITYTTSGTSYTVQAVSSTTVITVIGDASGETSGDTFTVTANHTITRWIDANTIWILNQDDVAVSAKQFTLTSNGDYLLPEDVANIIGPITFASDEAIYPIKMASESMIRTKRMSDVGSSAPTHAAIRWRQPDETHPQRLELMLWPSPDGNYNLTYRYMLQPARLDSLRRPYPVGPMSMGEVYIQACRMAAEHQIQKDRGVEWAKYQEMLAEAIRRDQLLHPESLGYNGDEESIRGREYRSYRTATTYDNTYNPWI